MLMRIEGSTVTLVAKAEAPKIGVDWHMLASDAKSKVDEQINRKKEAYDDLMKKRTIKMKRLETLFRLRSKAFSAASSQMRSKDEDVAIREQELRRAEKLHQESLRERDESKRLKDSANNLMKETSETMNEVQIEISKLNEEMEKW